MSFEDLFFYFILELYHRWSPIPCQSPLSAARDARVTLTYTRYNFNNVTSCIIQVKNNMTEGVVVVIRMMVVQKSYKYKNG